MQINVIGKTCHISLTEKSAIYIIKFRSLSLKTKIEIKTFDKAEINDFLLSCQEASNARLPLYNVTKTVNTFIQTINTVDHAKNIQPRGKAAAIH